MEFVIQIHFFPTIDCDIDITTIVICVPTLGICIRLAAGCMCVHSSTLKSQHQRVAANYILKLKQRKCTCEPFCKSLQCYSCNYFGCLNGVQLSLRKLGEWLLYNVSILQYFITIFTMIPSVTLFQHPNILIVSNSVMQTDLVNRDVVLRTNWRILCPANDSRENYVSLVIVETAVHNAVLSDIQNYLSRLDDDAQMRFVRKSKCRTGIG